VEEERAMSDGTVDGNERAMDEFTRFRAQAMERAQARIRAAAEEVVRRKDAFFGARYSSPGRVELLEAIEKLRAALASREST
jgi:hypothetical protein